MASLYIYKEKAFESIFYGDSSLWVSVESMTILSKGGRGPLLCGEGVREGGGSGLGWAGLARGRPRGLAGLGFVDAAAIGDYN